MDVEEIIGLLKSYCKTPALRIVAIIAILCVSSILLFSCGSARTVARVYNKAESTTTTISVSGNQGGSTSVTVTPSTSLQVDLNPNF